MTYGTVTTAGLGVSRLLNGKAAAVYPGLDMLKDVSPVILEIQFSAAATFAEALETAHASAPSKR